MTALPSIWPVMSRLNAGTTRSWMATVSITGVVAALELVSPILSCRALPTMLDGASMRWPLATNSPRGSQLPVGSVGGAPADAMMR